MPARAAARAGTTRAEDLGVKAVTTIYPRLVFAIASVMANLLGFPPMNGALALSIRQPVVGSVAIVAFGLLAAPAHAPGSRPGST